MSFSVSKKLKIILASAVLLGVLFFTIVGYWLYQSLDSLIASSIRTYGSDIAGVPVNVKSVRLNTKDGNMTIRGLVVKNPNGYRTDHAISLDEVSVTVDTSSITSKVIHIKNVFLVKPDVSYESHSGFTNFDAIQRHVDLYTTSHFGKSETHQKSGGRKMVIDHLTIQGANVTFASPMTLGQMITLPMPDIHLSHIGEQSGGATPQAVIKQVLTSFQQGVVHVVGSVVGGAVNGVGKGLKGGVNQVQGRIKGLFK